MVSNIIGIQGAKGSFSEQAAKVFSKNHGIKNYSISYLISSEADFLVTDKFLITKNKKK